MRSMFQSKEKPTDKAKPRRPSAEAVQTSTLRNDPTALRRALQAWGADAEDLEDIMTNLPPDGTSPRETAHDQESPAAGLLSSALNEDYVGGEVVPQDPGVVEEDVSVEKKAGDAEEQALDGEKKENEATHDKTGEPTGEVDEQTEEGYEPQGISPVVARPVADDKERKQSVLPQEISFADFEVAVNEVEDSTPVTITLDSTQLPKRLEGPKLVAYKYAQLIILRSAVKKGVRLPVDFIDNTESLERRGRTSTVGSRRSRSSVMGSFSGVFRRSTTASFTGGVRPGSTLSASPESFGSSKSGKGNIHHQQREQEARRLTNNRLDFIHQAFKIEDAQAQTLYRWARNCAQDDLEFEYQLKLQLHCLRSHPHYPQGKFISPDHFLKWVEKERLEHRSSLLLLREGDPWKEVSDKTQPPSPPTGLFSQLTVRAVEAKDLGKSEGESEGPALVTPFCTFHLLHGEYVNKASWAEKLTRSRCLRTATSFGDCWLEEFSCAVGDTPSSSSQVVIAVWSEDIATGDCIAVGQVTLTVAELPCGQLTDMWIPVAPIDPEFVQCILPKLGEMQNFNTSSTRGSRAGSRTGSRRLSARASVLVRDGSDGATRVTAPIAVKNRNSIVSRLFKKGQPNSPSTPTTAGGPQATVVTGAPVGGLRVKLVRIVDSKPPNLPMAFNSLFSTLIAHQSPALFRKSAAAITEATLAVDEEDELHKFPETLLDQDCEWLLGEFANTFHIPPVFQQSIFVSTIARQFRHSPQYLNLASRFLDKLSEVLMESEPWMRAEAKGMFDGLSQLFHKVSRRLAFFKDLYPGNKPEGVITLLIRLYSKLLQLESRHEFLRVAVEQETLTSANGHPVDGAGARRASKKLSMGDELLKLSLQEARGDTPGEEDVNLSDGIGNDSESQDSGDDGEGEENGEREQEEPATLNNFNFNTSGVPPIFTFGKERSVRSTDVLRELLIFSFETWFQLCVNDATAAAAAEFDRNHNPSDGEEGEVQEENANTDHNASMADISVDSVDPAESKEEKALAKRGVMRGVEWLDDAAVSECTACQQPFSVSRRKHHCRRCGKIFCNGCSKSKMVLEVKGKKVRVCDRCFALPLVLEDSDSEHEEEPVEEVESLEAMAARNSIENESAVAAVSGTDVKKKNEKHNRDKEKEQLLRTLEGAPQILITLSDTIVADWVELADVFEDVFPPQIELSYECVKTQYKGLRQSVASLVKPSTPVVGLLSEQLIERFVQAYHKIRELHRHILDAYGEDTVELMPITQMFLPLLKRWMTFKKTERLKWIDSAVKSETWTPISDQILYSHSLQDFFNIITPYVEIVAPIKDLSDEDGSVFRSIGDQMLTDIAEMVASFATTLSEGQIKAARAVTNTKKKTVDFEVSQSLCVRLNSLHELRHKLASFLENVVLAADSFRSFDHDWDLDTRFQDTRIDLKEKSSSLSHGITENMNLTIFRVLNLLVNTARGGAGKRKSFRPGTGIDDQQVTMSDLVALTESGVGEDVEVGVASNADELCAYLCEQFGTLHTHMPDMLFKQALRQLWDVVVNNVTDLVVPRRVHPKKPAILLAPQLQILGQLVETLKAVFLADGESGVRSHILEKDVRKLQELIHFSGLPSEMLDIVSLSENETGGITGGTGDWSHRTLLLNILDSRTRTVEDSVASDILMRLNPEDRPPLEVFENQRRQSPFSEFGTSLLRSRDPVAWSDRQGLARKKDAAAGPDSGWTDGWELWHSQGRTGVDGWEYSNDFYNTPWSPHETPVAFVRSRRWVKNLGLTASRVAAVGET